MQTTASVSPAVTSVSFHRHLLQHGNAGARHERQHHGMQYRRGHHRAVQHIPIGGAAHNSSPLICPISGTFGSFSDAFSGPNGAEFSRVVGGIHTPLAVQDALQLGDLIGAGAYGRFVPEPSSALLLAPGFVAFGRLRRRKAHWWPAPLTSDNQVPLHEALLGFPPRGANYGRRTPRNTRHDRRQICFVTAIYSCFSLRKNTFFVILGYCHEY
jgi:hypothetical protein